MYELIPWLEGARASGALTQAEEARLRGELWVLLAQKARLLSQGDSSIRTEQAEALLQSLGYVVSLALEPLGPEQAARVLAARPLPALYREGFRRLDRRLERAEAAYARALKNALPFDNLAYRDTLRSVGAFFSAYRPHLFAADVPVMIDYPLFCPVEGLGASYIEAYLTQWTRENDFLRRFEFSRVRRLVDAHFPDARAQVVNLFEPVATNALGLRLAGADPRGLRLSPEEISRVWALAEGAGEGALVPGLMAAADALAAEFDADGALLRAAAGELAARLGALPPEAAGGVFTRV